MREQDRMRQLVGQHALEERGCCAAPATGILIRPSVLAARPVGCTRDVAELFLRIQDGDDGVRRIDAERLADAPERGAQDGGRIRGQRLFGAPLEHHAEAIGAPLLEAAVRVLLFPPDLQLIADRTVLRCIFERVLVGADGEGQIALVVGDRAKQARRFDQPRIAVDGLAQSRQRLLRFSLLVRRRPGAE